MDLVELVERSEEKFHSVCKPKLSFFLDSVELRDASLCGNRSLKKKKKKEKYTGEKVEDREKVE